MPQNIEILYDGIKSNPINIVTDGNGYLLQVKVRPSAFLYKVVVDQNSGTPVGFTVDVLNSKLGLTPGEQAAPITLPSGWRGRRVTATLTAIANAAAEDFTPAGNAYRNSDGPDTTSQTGAASVGSGFTNAQTYIYVLLRPSAGAGANSKWNIAMTIVERIGGE
jgi:hypothetical protein